jgi:hypothetical protein
MKCCKFKPFCIHIQLAKIQKMEQLIWNQNMSYLSVIWNMLFYIHTRIFLEFLTKVLRMKFETCLLPNNAFHCRICQAFWRFRLFICLDKLSSPPGHCFLGSEYWHSRAGDPLYCVRTAAPRSVQYASVLSALVFTKIFFHNILDIIRRVFYFILMFIV